MKWCRFENEGAASFGIIEGDEVIAVTGNPFESYQKSDERFPLKEGETPVMRSIRFRTLGCYPLTGAVESEAKTLPEVIQETLLTTTSERQGRAIDKDAGGAGMEKKKQEGYF